MSKHPSPVASECLKLVKLSNFLQGGWGAYSALVNPTAATPNTLSGTATVSGMNHHTLTWLCVQTRQAVFTYSSGCIGR